MPTGTLAAVAAFEVICRREDHETRFGIGVVIV